MNGAYGRGGAPAGRVDGQKIEAVWSYRTSPLFSEAERVALDLALAAASQPNDVSDALMLE